MSRGARSLPAARRRPRAVRVLVTGGRGFLGSHVVARLRQSGCDVTLAPGDVRRLGRYRGRPDVVCHLAGVLKPGASGGWGELYDVNVNGTLAALELCRRAGARCVFASSSAVYRPAQDPAARLREDSPLEPVGPYGISKWLAEGLCRYFAAHHRVATWGLRLFNLYGPGQDPAFLLPHIVERLRHDEAVTLQTPEAVRDFLHVADAAEAVVEACRRPGDGWRALNVGSGVAARVQDQVRRIAALLGVAPRMARPVDAPVRADAVVADVTQIARCWGWRPRIGLADGLAGMVRGQGAAVCA